MNKTTILIAIVFFLLVMENSVTLLAQDREPVEYEELPEIKVHVDTEIGEREGYLPGQLRDLILMSDGTLLVSDLQKKTIEQFNAEGKHMGTIAREGKGPGELPFSYSLIDGGNDTLLVWNSDGKRLDYFARGQESSRYEYIKATAQQEFDGQRLELLGARSVSQYYAITDLPGVALVKRDVPDYRMRAVAVVDKSLQVVRDSLHMMKTPNHLFGDPSNYSSQITMNGLTYLGIPPYRYQDWFLPVKEGGYMIARPDSNALFVYGSDHVLDKHISFNIKERRIQSSDLDYVFETRPMAGEARIRQKLERHIAETKPPFLNAWISEDHIWLHTDYSKQGKQFMVFTMEGEPVGTFMLPAIDDIKVIEGEYIYTIHKNPAKGHSIRIYSVDL